MQYVQLIANIQIRGGLVEQQHIGALGQGHRDPHALRLAARKRRYRAAGMLGQPRHLERPGDHTLVLVGARRAAHAVIREAAVAHQLLHRQVTRRGIFLMHDGDQASEIAQTQRAHIAAAQMHAASGGLQVFRQQIEQRRLARPVRPDERGDLPLGDGRVKAVEDGHAPVVVCEPQPADGENAAASSSLVCRVGRVRRLVLRVIRHRYHAPFGAAG